jgi:two-component system sensor histidine kinase FlrB
MGALQSTQVKDLKETFRVFSKLSETLEHSYLHLEDRISDLSVQLADVQEQKRKASNETDRVADRLNTILDALPAGIVVLGPDGTIQDCNPAAIDLLQSPLRNENWLDVVERVFDLQSVDNDDIWLKDGRCVSLATCPLGQEPGQVILLNDVTETRKLQNKLNQHKRLTAIGEMAAGMAHQIRTPLSSGVLCCSQLKNPNLTEQKRAEVLEKVLSHMGDVEKVINNMLVFSRSGFEGH